MSIDRASFGIVFDFKLFKTLQSLEGIPVKGAFLLEQFIEPVLFEIGIVV